MLVAANDAQKKKYLGRMTEEPLIAVRMSVAVELLCMCCDSLSVAECSQLHTCTVSIGNIADVLQYLHCTLQ